LFHLATYLVGKSLRGLAPPRMHLQVVGSLRKEIDYLIEKGYKLSEDGKELIK